MPRKTYRICGRCAYYCRREESPQRCPYCRTSLLEACPCGREIEDPSVPRCPGCRRDYRLAAMLDETRPLSVDALLGRWGTDFARESAWEGEGEATGRVTEQAQPGRGED